tara:strand:+ start:56 stop:196 length:141 start_codon:yes stop_codon:yes gene_type:complete
MRCLLSSVDKQCEGYMQQKVCSLNVAVRRKMRLLLDPIKTNKKFVF